METASAARYQHDAIKSKSRTTVLLCVFVDLGAIDNNFIPPAKYLLHFQ